MQLTQHASVETREMFRYDRHICATTIPSVSKFPTMEAAYPKNCRREFSNLSSAPNPAVLERASVCPYRKGLLNNTRESFCFTAHRDLVRHSQSKCRSNRLRGGSLQ